MKIAFITLFISPHQLPFSRALVKQIGAENYHYIYTCPLTAERREMGWDDRDPPSWCIHGDELHPALLEADLVFSGIRSLRLFEMRNRLGKRTVYITESWFKPPVGIGRMLFPHYLRMARRIFTAVASESFSLMPVGIHAARDMARAAALLSGDLRALFRAPKVAFESCPCGAIVPLEAAIGAGVLPEAAIAFGRKHGFVQIPRDHWGKVKPQGIYAKMRLWGYFVEAGDKPQNTQMGTEGQDCRCEDNHERHETARKKAGSTEGTDNALNHNSSFVIHNSGRAPRVLWVGRMLKLKRVGDLIKACGREIPLSLYGNGPEKQSLESLARGRATVTFHDFVPIAAVRPLMRAHTHYVLPSDGNEGWGVVINEALSEGMRVLGTVEAGASATLFPPSHLYRIGDVKRLRTLLTHPVAPLSLGNWTVPGALSALTETFLAPRAARGE